MKKLLSVVLASLIAVPSVFGNNSTVTDPPFDPSVFRDESNRACNAASEGILEKQKYALAIRYGNNISAVPAEEFVKIAEGIKDREDKCEQEYIIKPKVKIKEASNNGIIKGVVIGAACTALAVVVGKCASDHPLKKTA